MLIGFPAEHPGPLDLISPQTCLFHYLCNHFTFSLIYLFPLGCFRVYLLMYLYSVSERQRRVAPVRGGGGGHVFSVSPKLLCTNTQPDGIVLTTPAPNLLSSHCETSHRNTADWVSVELVWRERKTLMNSLRLYRKPEPQTPSLAGQHVLLAGIVCSQ